MQSILQRSVAVRLTNGPAIWRADREIRPCRTIRVAPALFAVGGGREYIGRVSASLSQEERVPLHGKRRRVTAVLEAQIER
jgi:hypothetical protein